MEGQQPIYTGQTSNLTGERTNRTESDRNEGEKTINDLANDALTLMHMFSFLDRPDLGKAAQVCKDWNRISSDDFVWRSWVQELPDNYQDLPQETLKEKYGQCQIKWKEQIEAALKIADGILNPNKGQTKWEEKPTYPGTKFPKKFVDLLNDLTITRKEKIEALEKWLNSGDKNSPYIMNFITQEINSKEHMELALKAGANPNLCNYNYDNTFPLFYLIYDRNFELIELLLNHGADINIRKPEGSSKPFTPLDCAFDNFEMIEWLIIHGAKPDLDFLRDVFYDAIDKKNYQLVELLIKNGANPNIKYGIDLLITYAIEKGDLEMVKLLHGLGAVLEPEVLPVSKYPLIQAIEKGDHEMVKLLLSLEANPNILSYFNDNISDYPLRYAVRQGDLEMVRLLKSYGADVTCNKDRPLIFDALEEGNFEMVKLLVEIGADPNIECGNLTPLSLAKQNLTTIRFDKKVREGLTQIIEFLSSLKK